MSKLPSVSIQTLDDIRRAESAAPTTVSMIQAPIVTARDVPAEAAIENFRPLDELQTAKARHAFDGQTRRHRATTIVHQYAGYGALAGLAIMPWLKAIAVSVVAERMIRAISLAYDQPVGLDHSTRLTAALISGLAISGISGLTSGKSIVGMTLSSAGSYLVLQAIGRRYIERLEGGRSGAPSHWRLGSAG